MELLESALKCVKEDYSSLPDGADLILKIEKKFSFLFENPPYSEINKLCNATFDEHETKQVLFCPSSSQIWVYPMLFKGTLDTEDSKLHDLKLSILSLIYIVHRKRWSFLRDFVINGGLDVLSQMIMDKNLYSRGQVVEIFLAITDCDTYDWFLPLSGDHVRTALYLRMVSLYKSDLISNLVSNRDDSYPGGSMRCLQLLAFWLSWVRFHFTNGTNVLKLSSLLLDSLTLWSQRKHTSHLAAADINEDFSASEDPEVQLAETLLRDFSEAGVAENESSEASISGLFVHGCVVPKFTEHDMFNISLDVLADDDKRTAQQKPAARVHEEQKLPAPPPSTVSPIAASSQSFFKFKTWSPLEVKNKGNEFFNEGKFLAAGQCYLHALSDLQTAKGRGGLDESPSLGATLNFNVASVLWKLSTLSPEDVALALEKVNTGYECVNSPTLEQLRSMIASRERMLLGCVAFCEECLSMSQGDHKKALYRLSAALLELDRAAEAITKLDGYFRQHKVQTAAAGGDEFAALHDMRRKCIARVVLHGGVTSLCQPSGDKDSAVTAALPQIVGEATSKVLSQLQARRGRIHNSVSHPWDGVIRDGDTDSGTEESSRPLADAVENAFVELQIGDSLGKSEGDNKDYKIAKTLSGDGKKKDGGNKKKLDAVALEEKKKKCVRIGIKFRKQSTSLDSNWTVSSPCAECVDHQNVTAKIIRQMWKESLSLVDIFTHFALDEEMLLCLLMVLQLADTDATALWGDMERERVTMELKGSPRLTTTLTLLLNTSGDMSSSLLMTSLKSTMQSLHCSIVSSRPADWIPLSDDALTTDAENTVLKRRY